MLKIGLTGGIACGKTHVLRQLAAAGFHTLDLDQVAHEVIAPGGPAYDGVVAAFGSGILSADGTVDRKALGAIVFADPEARARLNALVHPHVREEEARGAALHRSEPGAVVVTDAALLVESGMHLRFDRLVVVHCGEDVQLARLMKRGGIDEAAARSRIGAQMPIADKRRFAHFEVDTSTPFEDTDAAVGRLALEIRGLAAAPPAPRVAVPLERAIGAFVHGPARGPAGLDSAALLHDIVTAGGLEMERIARLAFNPGDTPWYRAGRASGDRPGPEALAVPLVLWALARGAPDQPHLIAAAASLARVTHRAPSAIAGACAFALALQDVAERGNVTEDFPLRVAGWKSAAERWAGAPAPATLDPVFRAAPGHPRDVSAARSACRQDGGDPDLAGAVVGMAVGAPPSAAPVGLAFDLEGLGRVD